MYFRGLEIGPTTPGYGDERDFLNEARRENLEGYMYLQRYLEENPGVIIELDDIDRDMYRRGPAPQGINEELEDDRQFQRFLIDNPRSPLSFMDMERIYS